MYDGIQVPLDGSQFGTMNSVVEGDEAAVFDGLRQAFRAVASRGFVVLVATVSNACRQATQEPVACD